MTVRLLAPNFDAAVARNVVSPITMIAGVIAIALGAFILDLSMIAGGGVLLLSSVVLLRDKGRGSFLRGIPILFLYMVMASIGVALISF